MKKQFTTLMIMATIFGTTLQAQEMTLPKIEAPQALQEGTQRVLNPSQIAELLPWAKDSKIFLNDLLENTQGLSTLDQIERLTDGVANAVGESAPKNSELLMRYALNRALVLNGILDKEMSAEAVGTADVKLRVLKASIKMALKYYDTDMALLTKKSTAPYVTFGLDYFEFLNELNKSIFDASAQYSIQRTSLEWLQWDMYRDLNNTSYAPQIVKINNGLKTFPTRKLTDAQSIAYIRQMKGLAGQLRVGDTLRKLQLEKEMVEARSEAERQAIFARREAEAQRLRDEEQNRELTKILEALNNGKPVSSQVIRTGDIALYGNTTRTVGNVTDDNQVILAGTYSAVQIVVNRTEVEKGFTNYLGMSAGDVVLHGDTVRNIDYIGERGSVALRGTYSINAGVAKYGTYTKAVISAGKFTVGDSVLYNNQVRTIQYMDAYGRLVLTGTYSYNTAYVTTSQVSKVTK